MKSRYTRIWLRQATSSISYAWNVARPRQSLFLLSHMRGYTSLLCHILNTNPEIDGYGELAVSYRSPLDMINMRHQVRLTTGQPLRGTYVLDKLLHPGATLDDSILTAPDSTVMIGIREPESTVRSIRAMGLAKANPDWKADPERACRHYTNRLEYCLESVRKRPDTLVFPMDALIDDTAVFLSGLTAWLGLDEPLRPEYEVGAMTGTPRFGDTSPQIHSGALTTDRPAHDVEIPPDLLDKVWEAYDRTLDELFDCADQVLCPDGRIARAPASDREAERSATRR